MQDFCSSINHELLLELGAILTIFDSLCQLLFELGAVLTVFQSLCQLLLELGAVLTIFDSLCHHVWGLRLFYPGNLVTFLDQHVRISTVCYLRKTWVSLFSLTKKKPFSQILSNIILQSIHNKFYRKKSTYHMFYRKNSLEKLKEKQSKLRILKLDNNYHYLLSWRSVQVPLLQWQHPYWTIHRISPSIKYKKTMQTTL